MVSTSKLWLIVVLLCIKHPVIFSHTQTNRCSCSSVVDLKKQLCLQEWRAGRHTGDSQESCKREALRYGCYVHVITREERWSLYMMRRCKRLIGSLCLFHPHFSSILIISGGVSFPHSAQRTVWLSSPSRPGQIIYHGFAEEVWRVIALNGNLAPQTLHFRENQKNQLLFVCWINFCLIRLQRCESFLWKGAVVFCHKRVYLKLEAGNSVSAAFQ